MRSSVLQRAMFAALVFCFIECLAVGYSIGTAPVGDFPPRGFSVVAFGLVFCLFLGMLVRYEGMRREATGVLAWICSACLVGCSALVYLDCVSVGPLGVLAAALFASALAYAVVGAGRLLSHVSEMGYQWVVGSSLPAFVLAGICLVVVGANGRSLSDASFFFASIGLFVSLSIRALARRRAGWQASGDLRSGAEVRPALELFAFMKKPFAGIFLLAAITSFHWQLNAVRNAGMQASETFPMFFVAAGVSSFVLFANYIIIRFFSKMVHLRTMYLASFYLVGAAFFVPPLLTGMRGISIPGISQAACAVYGVLLVPYLWGKMKDSREEFMHSLCMALVAATLGLVLGWLLGWLCYGSLAHDDVALIAVIIVSVYLIMVAPSFLFKSQNVSLAAESGVGNAYLKSCDMVSRRYHLSPRESEVLELAGRGYSASAISTSLYISENTAKVHMRNLYQKLEIHSKQELIRVIEEAEAEGGW